MDYVGLVECVINQGFYIMGCVYFLMSEYDDVFEYGSRFFSMSLREWRVYLRLIRMDYKSDQELYDNM